MDFGFKMKGFTSKLALWAGQTFVLTAFVVSCGKPSAPSASPPANAVATIGSNAITVESFQRELARRSNSGNGKLQSAELLEEMIRFEAMHAKALAEGYDRKPEMVERWRRMLVAQYREDRMETGETLPSVSEEEIRASYETNQAAFTLPAARRANVIFLSTPRVIAPEKREGLRLRAETILAEARATNTPEALAALVSRVSEHQATRYRAGDAGWFSLEDKSPAWNATVVAALFKITAPGGFAPVIDTESGFYLVRLAEERTARVKPIEEVREAIRYRLAREKQVRREEELFTEAKAGLDIQINHALLNSIVPKPAPRETRPPALPGQAASQ